MERVMGIEPTSTAWKAEVLPLNYTRRATSKRLKPAEKLTRHPRPPLSLHGGGGRIRTYEGISRQIYSLLPLAAWVPLREQRAAYSHRPDERCQCSPTPGTGRWRHPLAWRMAWRTVRWAAPLLSPVRLAAPLQVMGKRQARMSRRGWRTSD